MNSVMNKIFADKIDSYVHDEFVKFSRGVFNDRYIVEAKRKSDNFSIKTSNEFANFFVRKGLEKVNDDVDISGVIVSTFDITKEAGFEISNIKQFMGIKQVVISGKIQAKKIISLMDKYPKAFYALSFNLKDYELKIKAKAPKSAKPSTKGDSEIKADFCSLKTNDSEIVKDLFFDCLEFSKISIRHSLNIEKIEIPKEIADPVKMREGSIRVGKIIRKMDIDGNIKLSEKNFKA